MTLKEHPSVVPLFDTHIPLGPNALAAREAAISILLDGGIPPEDAARAFMAVARFATGFASRLREPSPAVREDEDEIRQFYLSMDPQQYPATLASAPYLPISLDYEFRFGLRLFIDGLATPLIVDARGEIRVTTSHDAVRWN